MFGGSQEWYSTSKVTLYIRGWSPKRVSTAPFLRFRVDPLFGMRSSLISWCHPRFPMISHGFREASNLHGTLLTLGCTMLTQSRKSLQHETNIYLLGPYLTVSHKIQHASLKLKTCI